MSKQPEQVLEEQLLTQLQTLGYESVLIKDEKDLIANLKSQLERHSQIKFTDKQFEKGLNILSKGSIFEKAKTHREKQHFVWDNGYKLCFKFVNTGYWCQNQFQVTHQVNMEGKFKNRYDITLLINGLPFMQIELKRRGLEPKEAYNQINRYQRHELI